jgi:hypothetical protein
LCTFLGGKKHILQHWQTNQLLGDPKWLLFSGIRLEVLLSPKNGRTLYSSWACSTLTNTYHLA